MLQQVQFSIIAGQRVSNTTICWHVHCVLALTCQSEFKTRLAMCTVCVPFPKAFETNGFRDYGLLAASIQTLPSLATFTENRPPNHLTLTDPQRAALQWVVCGNTRRPPAAFVPISLQTFHEEVPQARVLWLSSSETPNLVFKLLSGAHSNIPPRDDGLSAGTSQQRNDMHANVLLAFHGTRFENIHSILRTGLLSMSGTRLERSGAIFGEGIYLSTELQVAYSFCQPGERWKGSKLAPEGTRLRCVLVCGVAREAMLRGDDNSSPEKAPNALHAAPDHYVRVNRPDMVTLKYILVYLDTDAESKRAPCQHQMVRPTTAVFMWATLIAYGIWILYTVMAQRWPWIKRVLRRQLGLNIFYY